MAELSPEQVRHVARLARLRLEEDQVEPCREELAHILEHLARVGGVDVRGVEPLSHPIDLTDRLDEDVVGEAMAVERLLELAPAVKDRYVAVPKVLD